MLSLVITIRPEKPAPLHRRFVGGMGARASPKYLPDT